MPSLRRRGEHADFERVQRFARIAVAHFGEKCRSASLVDFDIVVAESAFLISQRAFHKCDSGR